MGYNISQLKLQYYPTDLRICNFFTFLHYGIIHKDEINAKSWFENELVIEAKSNINEYDAKMKATDKYKFKKDWHKIPTYSTYKFQNMVVEKNIKTDDFIIKEINPTNGEEVAIVDLFAGKGEWLNLYKYYLEYEFTARKCKTLGVELAKERYEDMSKNTDYSYYSAFEDVELPKEFISLLYFNPPYDTVDKERLTKKYLQEIIDRQILISGGCYVDFVIRDDDFRDCLDLILDHFYIMEDTIFKAPSDEFNKFKQIVFTARYGSSYKPSLDTRYLIEARQRDKDRLLKIVDNVKQIDLTEVKVDTIKECRALVGGIVENKINAITLKNNNKSKISSNNDMVWKWFKESTEIKTENIKNMIVPKHLKKGEIVNVISSGFLNGNMGNHIISGGTKQVTEEYKSIMVGNDGKEREQIEIRKINKPYLNVLLPTGEIKKLLDKEKVESE